MICRRSWNWAPWRRDTTACARTSQLWEPAAPGQVNRWLEGSCGGSSAPSQSVKNQQSQTFIFYDCHFPLSLSQACDSLVTHLLFFFLLFIPACPAENLFLFSHVALAVRRCSPCPEGWLHLEDKCYYFSPDKLDWEKSRDSCTSMGSHLAILYSHKQHVSSLLHKHMSTIQTAPLTALNPGRSII